MDHCQLDGQLNHFAQKRKDNQSPSIITYTSATTTTTTTSNQDDMEEDGSLYEDIIENGGEISQGDNVQFPTTVIEKSSPKAEAQTSSNRQPAPIVEPQQEDSDILGQSYPFLVSFLKSLLIKKKFISIV